MSAYFFASNAVKTSFIFGITTSFMYLPRSSFVILSQLKAPGSAPAAGASALGAGAAALGAGSAGAAGGALGLPAQDETASASKAGTRVCFMGESRRAGHGRGQDPLFRPDRSGSRAYGIPRASSPGPARS